MGARGRRWRHHGAADRPGAPSRHRSAHGTLFGLGERRQFAARAPDAALFGVAMLTTCSTRSGMKGVIAWLKAEKTDPTADRQFCGHQLLFLLLAMLQCVAVRIEPFVAVERRSIRRIFGARAATSRRKPQEVASSAPDDRARARDGYHSAQCLGCRDAR